MDINTVKELATPENIAIVSSIGWMASEIIAKIPVKQNSVWEIVRDTVVYVIQRAFKRE